MTQAICNCSRPVPDGWACHECAEQARLDLVRIAELSLGLDDKLARRHGLRPGGGSRARETPLPYDPRVRRTTDPIRVAMWGTCAVVIESRGVQAPDYLSGDSIGGMALWLTSHIDWMRTSQEGAEEIRQTSFWRASLETLLDNPPDSLYAGTCGDDSRGTPCPGELYVERIGRRAATHARCPRCETLHEVEKRRDELMRGLGDYQATMRELTALSPLLAISGTSRSMMYEYAKAGILPAVGSRLEGNLRGEWRTVATYRIGDVAPAAAEWQRRQEKRALTQERHAERSPA